LPEYGGEIRHLRRWNLDSLGVFFRQVKAEILDTLGGEIRQYSGLTEEKKDFVRGFVEIRGSVDTTAKLIAQDYFYNSKIEIKKAQLLTDMMNLPIRFANFNPRNLQPQYVNGENKRNTQFRIHAFYYAKNIGFINDYKAKIFETVYHFHRKKVENLITYYDVEIPKSRNDDVSFIKYLNFFTNNIYDKELTSTAIKELRISLGFDTNESTKTSRNASIIELYRLISEDKCAICDTTKTFENKKTGRQHFEIHHMISYNNGNEYDNIANLVKLCPTCHDSLKRNHASKPAQVKSILKIFHEHSEIYEFTSSYLGIENINNLADKIWSMLG